MLQGACSCAGVAAYRSYCAAIAIVAIATAAGGAGAWRGRRLGARAHVDTNGPDGAGWPMPSGRGAGANGAVLAVVMAQSVVAAMVVMATGSRT